MNTRNKNTDLVSEFYQYTIYKYSDYVDIFTDGCYFMFLEWMEQYRPNKILDCREIEFLSSIFLTLTYCPGQIWPTLTFDSWKNPTNTLNCEDFY